MVVLVLVCGGRRDDANGAHEGSGHGVPRGHAEEEERDLVAHAHAREAREERQQLAAHERGGAAENAVAGHAEALQQAALRAEEVREEVVEEARAQPAAQAHDDGHAQEGLPPAVRVVRARHVDAPEQHLRLREGQQHGGVQVNDAPAAEHPPAAVEERPNAAAPTPTPTTPTAVAVDRSAPPRPATGDVAKV